MVKPLRVIHSEIIEKDSLVDTFFVLMNFRTVEVLSATASEALCDVDEAQLQAFLEARQMWRDGSYVYQNMRDPTGSRLVPEDRLDELEA